eukprot:6717576-Prymnesium_polylepis.1
MVIVVAVVAASVPVSLYILRKCICPKGGGRFTWGKRAKAGPIAGVEGNDAAWPVPTTTTEEKRGADSECDGSTD